MKKVNKEKDGEKKAPDTRDYCKNVRKTLIEHHEQQQ